jgi:arylsulfatase A-like enzyme
MARAPVPVSMARLTTTAAAALAIAFADPAGAAAPPANVLIWLIDDTGFGQMSAFGGPVETPTLERLAARGLRFNNFHSTPICSATRAALLTGRNPHSVGVGAHAAAAQEHPGHNARIPASAGTLADYLHAAGYLTFALGKWDHLPSEHVSAAGPFTYWPSDQGFDRFYGFLGADADHFRPVLWSDHAPVEAPERLDYHLTSDLADHAIDWICARDAAPERRPFFLYWATGAVHAPHHAPESHLTRYRGRFDRGWDVARAETLARQKAMGLVPADVGLAERPEGMPAWDSLSPDARRLYARQMEAFAAQLTHADAEFGRILDTLEARGELENTIVLVTADNGASAEGAPEGTYNETLYVNARYPDVAENLAHYSQWGGPDTYPNYATGWAVAGNTPFRYYKQTTYEGGVRVPLIVAGPLGASDPGGVRSQFHHVIDIAPTVLQAAGVAPAPEIDDVAQSPLQGTSFAYAFASSGAQNPKSRQYFEMWGNRAIWAGGWKAVAAERTNTWAQGNEPPVSDETWELYDLTRDFNERHDLAEALPAKLAEMKALFLEEAAKFNVLPLTTQSAARAHRSAQAQKAFAGHGGVWRYPTPILRVPEVAMPPILSRSFRMTAALDVPAGASGVVMSAGGRFGGLSLFLEAGRPVFVVRDLNMSETRIAATQSLPAGASHLGLTLSQDDSGPEVVLSADGREIGRGRLTRPLPRTFSLTETFNLGADTGHAPDGSEAAATPLAGRLGEVVFDFN